MYCRQTVGWIKMKRGVEIGLGPGHTVLDGDPVPLPEKSGHSPPQFSAHVHCSQTAGWIKMPLGRRLTSAQATRVRWGPSSPQKGAQQPPSLFDPCLFGWRGGVTGKTFGLAISRSQVQILLEATVRNNLRQVVYTYVPLSPSSITWYRPNGSDAMRLGR